MCGGFYVVVEYWTSTSVLVWYEEDSNVVDVACEL